MAAFWCRRAVLLGAALLALVGLADGGAVQAQTPPGSGGLGVTPVATVARRATPQPMQRGPAPDLSAPLPVATLVPTSVLPTPTQVILPATLTATPTAIPTITPPATATVPPTATAAPPAATPTAAAMIQLPGVEPDGPRSGAESDGPPAGTSPRPVAAALPESARTAPPPRSYVIGLPGLSGPFGWLSESLLWLGVPSRTQYDGTAYASANCGPSALGMILEAYGLYLSTHEIRGYANYLQGTYGYDDGIALDHLAEIAKRSGLKPLGLYGGRGYQHWTVDDVRDHVLSGRPVIVLTKYRLLPGNGGFGGNINHYVVITGLLDDGFLYNDSAFGGGGGQGLVISEAQLEAAWATADIPRHAVAFGLGEQGYGLLNLDASRFGRGAGPAERLASGTSGVSRVAPPAAAGQPTNRMDRDEAARARLVTSADRTGAPAGSARASADPSTTGREALLASPAASSTRLLDTDLLGSPGAARTGALSSPPAVALPLQELDALVPELPIPELVGEPPLADALALEPPPLDDERPAGTPAFLLLFAGVGGLLLLLFAQSLWSAAGARLGRR